MTQDKRRRLGDTVPVERRTPIVTLTAEQVSQTVHQVLPHAHVDHFALTPGGRSNTNYYVECDGRSYVLRLYVRHPSVYAKEMALYRLLDRSIPVPRVIGHGRTGPLGYPFSLFERVAGLHLDALCARTDRAAHLRASQELGQILGRLATLRYGTRGLLSAKSAIAPLAIEPFDLQEFYRHCLFETPAAARLGPLRDRLYRYLRGPEPQPVPAHPHLVHGDFNPGNLLVREDGAVVAVLDWEFAHAGSLLADLGNLLRQRPECPLPDGFGTRVQEGLAASGVELPSDWRARALRADLGSAIEFLTSQDDRPQTQARALQQIRESLDFLGG